MTTTPPGRGAVALPAATGIFDRHGATQRLDGDGAPVSVRQVRLAVSLADFPDGADPVAGATVLVGGVLYAVVDVLPDSEGMAVLVLSGRSLASGSAP